MTVRANTIIWDWNGTLLNDTDICIESINSLLADRDLPLMNKEKYLDIFGFPVISYYQKLGFNFEKEPFDIPARQYIDQYTSRLKESRLHKDVIPVLSHFRQKGYRQFVLSASEKNILQNSIRHFNIDEYFEFLTGLDNHYAISKTDLGRELIRGKGIDPANTLMIGDTIHDYEVASELGCQCILVAGGHQHIDRLKKTGTTVLDQLDQLPVLLEKKR